MNCVSESNVSWGISISIFAASKVTVPPSAPTGLDISGVGVFAGVGVSDGIDVGMLVGVLVGVGVGVTVGMGVSVGVFVGVFVDV